MLKTLVTCMHVSPFRPCQKNHLIIAIISPGRDCIHLFIVDARSSLIPSKQLPQKRKFIHISSYLDVAVLNRIFKRPLSFNKINTLLMKVWSFTTSIGQTAQNQTTDSTVDPQYPQSEDILYLSLVCRTPVWVLQQGEQGWTSTMFSQWVSTVCQ